MVKWMWIVWAVFCLSLLPYVAVMVLTQQWGREVLKTLRGIEDVLHSGCVRRRATRLNPQAEPVPKHKENTP